MGYFRMVVNMLTNVQMSQVGSKAVRLFCVQNKLEVPEIEIHPGGAWGVRMCGYYRRMRIAVNPSMCAPPVPRNPRQWSYPGYVVDRTTYGVLAHELGHHVDLMMGDQEGLAVGKYYSLWSRHLQARSGEDAITTYCPNHAEWLAEMFRLFFTNPDLLKQLRPKTYDLLIDSFKPIETRCWEDVLWEAPERVQKAAMEKIRKANRPKRKSS